MVVTSWTVLQLTKGLLPVCKCRGMYRVFAVEIHCHIVDCIVCCVLV